MCCFMTNCSKNVLSNKQKLCNFTQVAVCVVQPYKRLLVLQKQTLKIRIVIVLKCDSQRLNLLTLTEICGTFI